MKVQAHGWTDSQVSFRGVRSLAVAVGSFDEQIIGLRQLIYNVKLKVLNNTGNNDKKI